MTASNISLASLASNCALALLDAKAHEDKAKAFKDAANVTIAQLHKAKAVIGRKGSCATATAFYDTLVAGGLAKGTASNYLSVFKDAVKTGKPVTDWNPNRKGETKGKGKGGKGKGQAAFADLLLKAFNHENGETLQALCDDILTKYEAAEVENIYQGFVNYLESEGYEITK